MIGDCPDQSELVPSPGFVCAKETRRQDRPGYNVGNLAAAAIPSIDHLVARGVLAEVSCSSSRQRRRNTVELRFLRNSLRIATCWGFL